MIFLSILLPRASRWPLLWSATPLCPACLFRGHRSFGRGRITRTTWRWFERARSDMLRLLGIDQRAAHEAGEGAFAVTDLALRYLRPARLDDAVLIRSTVAAVSRATCSLIQKALLGAELLCEAHVRVAFVSPAGRARRLPAPFLAAFSSLLAPPQEGPAVP